MLFITIYNYNETNEASDSDRHSAYHQLLSNAGNVGVKMRGLFVNESAHTAFFLLEADQPEQIAELLKPMQDLGRVESMPVIDRLAL